MTMPKEMLNQKSKAYLVHGGDARVFGEDADLRRKFNDTKINKRFKQVWEETIAPGLDGGQTVTADEAKELLGDRRAEFVKPGFEYRQFSVDTAAFLARLSVVPNSPTCDQLWPLGAHRDPTRLCVHFERVEDLANFSSLARSLKTEPKKLLLELAVDFMNKFPSHKLP